MKNQMIFFFEKIQSFCKKKHSEFILYLVSFLESIFFPIPTDIFLITYILSNKERFIKYIVLTTFFSVLGGVVSYIIGYYLWDNIISNKFLVESDLILKTNEFIESFQEFGILFVVIGGLSPFPYKITCLGSGFLGIYFPIFFFSSIFSRGLRFFFVGYLFYKYNDRANDFVKKYLNLLTLLIVALITLFLIYSKF